MAFITVKMVQKGMKFSEMVTLINEKVNEVNNAVKSLGEATADTMRANITASILRRPSTGVLAKSIKTYFFSDPLKTIVGVGALKDLPIYWHVMNYGATIDGTAFVPGMGKTVSGDFGGERANPAYQGTPGGAGIKMSHPGQHAVKASLVVTPKNYIEKTIFWLHTRIGNSLIV